MDAVWLQGSVGEALAQGLTEIAVKQPEDPVEYLAYWLLAHTENLNEREKRFQEQALLERERMEKQHEEEQAQRMREEEVRVLKQQALERARTMEKARRDLHVQRLDAYEERKAELEDDLKGRTHKVFVEAGTSAEDDVVEEHPISEVEKAAARHGLACNALRAVAGLSTYTPTPDADGADGKAGGEHPLMAGGADDDSSDSSDSEDDEVGEGAAAAPGGALAGERGPSPTGTEDAYSESGSAMPQSEPESNAFEDRLPNILSSLGATGLDLLRAQVESEWDAETNPSLFKALHGVMMLLGFTRASTKDAAKVKDVVNRVDPSMVDLMLRVKFENLPKPSKLKRASQVTQGMDVGVLVSPTPLGSYPAYVMFEWLRTGVALRNLVVNERLDAGDPLDEIEDQTFRVAEPGVPIDDDGEEDYESESDWMGLFGVDEANESAASYDVGDGDGSERYSVSGSYYGDSDYEGY